MEIVTDDSDEFITINNKNHDILNKKKKKKKKRKTNNTTSSSSSNGCCGILDEDIVVHEILTRVPVKSLVRFKSVCKHWKSVIPHCDPNLLIIVTSPEKWLEDDPRPNYCILTGNLIESFRGGGRTTTIDSTIETTLSFFPDQITNCINGWIFLIDSKFKHDPCLYNINTGEESPLFISPLFKQEIKRYDSIYHSASQFGYDPVTNEYKLVLASWGRDLSGKFKQICEVSTVVNGPGRVNNNAWRRVNQVVDNVVVVLGNSSVHVNGTIYWSSLSFKDYISISIVAFDVGSEKFRHISIPEFILAQSREYYDHLDENLNIDLLEVDGRVALQTIIGCYTVKLWIFDDDKKRITTMTGDKNWSELTINLPFRVGRHRYLHLHTIFDQIIIRTYEYEDFYRLYGHNKQNVSLYSFDRRKNILTMVDIRGIPFWIPPGYIHRAPLFTTFLKNV